MKKSWIVITSLAIVFVFAAVAASLYRSTSYNYKNPPAAEMPKNISSAPSLNWRIDARQMYNFSFDADITSFPLPDKSVKSGYSFKGILNFRVFEIKNDTVWAGVQIAPLSCIISGREEEKLAEIYSKFFIAAVRKEGTVTELYFPHDIAKQEQEGLSEILFMLQAVIPEGAEDKWDTQENHKNGDYVAQYRVNPTNDTIIKNKTVYLNSGEKEFTTDVLKSVFMVKVAAQTSWIEQMSGKEKLQIKDRSGKTILLTGTVINCKNIPYNPNKDLEIWRENRPLDVILASFTKKNVPAYSYWEKKQTNDSKAYFIKNNVRFENIIDKIRKDAKNNQLAHELVAFLRAFPTEANRIPEILLNADSDDFASSMLNILELSGTIESQKALMAILNDARHTEINKIRSIIAMAGLEKPTKEVIDALWDSYYSGGDKGSEKISDTSLLALGSLRKKLGNDGFDISRKLSDELKSASNYQKQRIIIKAIGNTFDSELISEVTPYVKSPNIMVREAVADVIGNTDSSATRETLSNLMLTENSHSVKISVMESLSRISSDSNTVDAVKNRVLKEEDSGLRYQMVSYLAKNAEKYPDSISVLKTLLPNETNRETIKLIVSAISKKASYK